MKKCQILLTEYQVCLAQLNYSRKSGRLEELSDEEYARRKYNSVFKNPKKKPAETKVEEPKFEEPQKEYEI